jgi:hypothetical protein
MNILLIVWEVGSYCACFLGAIYLGIRLSRELANDNTEETSA